MWLTPYPTTVCTELHPAAVAVLRVFVGGWWDEGIAHRLEISVWTVRRHVADRLGACGSVNRFAAGVATCRQGLV